MTNVDYNVQKNSWYSPKEIIERFEQLRSVYRGSIMEPDFKRAREMFTGAIALLGAFELSATNIYFLQSNNQSHSPDVMAAKQLEREEEPILAQLAQLEIVEMEEHYPGDDVAEFIRMKKLLPEQGYINDSNTLIICLVNKKIPLNRIEIHEKLMKLNPKCNIYIVGRVGEAEDETFCIFSAYPVFTIFVKYQISTTAAKYIIPSRIRFHLGMEKKISYIKTEMEPINTYDMLGLNQQKIENKFKSK